MTAEPEHTDVVFERTAQPAHSIHLQRVCEANAAIREGQVAMRNAVEDARKAGHTWEDIATALITSSRPDSPEGLGVGDVPSIGDIVQTVLGTGPVGR
jgi:hypothetical protein